jgi:hypothetical protein
VAAHVSAAAFKQAGLSVPQSIQLHADEVIE